jgi:DUF971 family protein
VPRPKKVLTDKVMVTIEWTDGKTTTIQNRVLREACPCALCQGEAHPFGGRGTLPMIQDIPTDVRAVSFRMVGLYAISFEWSDGHSTGIYPYDLLLGLASQTGPSTSQSSAP